MAAEEEFADPGAAEPAVGFNQRGGPQLKLRTFDGALGARDANEQYVEWKKEAQAIQLIYNMPEERFGLLLYVSLAPGVGGPRDLVQHLSLQELQTSKGIAELWAALDKEFVRQDYEKSDRAQGVYERLHRKAGQPMREYLKELRLALRKLHAEDAMTRVSDISFSRKMLRSLGLTKPEQQQVLAACGAVWDSAKIESALILMHGDCHYEDRRRAPQGYPGYVPKGGGKGKGKPKGKHTFVAAGEVAETEQDEAPEGRQDWADTFDAFDETELLESEEAEYADYEEYPAYAEEEETYYTSRPTSRPKGGKGQKKGRDKSSSSSTQADITRRKRSSRCADCGQLGHWRGDAACEHVRSGRTPPRSASGQAETAQPAQFAESYFVGVVTAADPPRGEDISETVVDGAKTSRGCQTLETRLHVSEVQSPPMAAASAAAYGRQVPVDPTAVNLECFTVGALKQWLSERGLSTRGNKADLVNRIHEFLSAQNSMQGDWHLPVCLHDVVISGGNSTHAWRRCKQCKRMVSRTCRATGEEEAYDDVLVASCSASDILVASLDDSCLNLILDSGCKRSVAGHRWHADAQRKFEQAGVVPLKVPCISHFRFGSDAVVEAQWYWRYPLVIGERCVILEISEVPSECPGLLSVDGMAALGMVIDFGQQKLQSSFLGVCADIISSPTGHPVLAAGVPLRSDSRLPREFGGTAEHATSVFTASRHGAEEEMFRAAELVTVPRGDRTNLRGDEAPPCSLLLGAYTRRGAGVSRAASLHADFLSKVHLAAKRRAGAGGRAPYLAVQLNKNGPGTPARLHRDAFNLPGSHNWVKARLIPNGNGVASGGRIWVADKEGDAIIPKAAVAGNPHAEVGMRGKWVDPCAEWVHFDATRLHYVEPPRNAERIAIVLHTPSRLTALSGAHWRELAQLGFDVKSIQESIVPTVTKELPCRP
eukprot:2208842-Amphidinium_carterae.1